MAKIIAHAPDRPAAVALLRRAILATHVAGVKTNLAFHAAMLAEPEFQSGGFDTGLVERVLARARVPAREVRRG